MNATADIAAPEEPVPYSAAAPAAPVPSKRLGFVAMLLGLGVLVGSVLASVLMGIAAAPYATAGPNRWGVDLELFSPDPTETTLAVLTFVHIVIGTGLGLWALTQGIIAVVGNRGRAYGVVAIVAAFIAPGVSLVVYLTTAVANAG